MQEQSKSSTLFDSKIIFAPLSIIASIAAFLSIPSIYGAVACSILGVACGISACRNQQKSLGIIGIGLNLLVLLALAVLMLSLSSYQPQ